MKNPATRVYKKSAFMRYLLRLVSASQRVGQQAQTTPPTRLAANTRILRLFVYLAKPIMPEMSNVRRSHTLRNTRSSMPAGHVTSKATALDDLGVLQEERSGAQNNIDTIEAQLRSEIFDRERANDKVRIPCAASNEFLCDCSSIF
jgi:hypothetical protein